MGVDVKSFFRTGGSLTLSIATNSIAALTPQVYAMVTLQPSTFGRFSALYLSFALMTAFSLSVVSDPWVIDQRRHSAEPPGDRKLYASIATLFVIASSIPLIAINWWIIRDWQTVIVATGCVATAAYRNCVRALEVYSRRFTRAALSDVMWMGGFAIAVAAFGSKSGESVQSVFAVWFCSTIASTAVLQPPRLSFLSAAKWLQSHFSSIRLLSRDTVIMEASYVGTPYVLLPVLGWSDFGLYRGVTNTSAPVRMVFSPIRPVIVGRPASVCSPRSVTIVVCSGAVAGALIGAVLTSLPHIGFDFGILGELSNLGAAAGVFVAGTTLITVYAVATRALVDARLLLNGRLAQILLGFGLPIGGYLLAGALGAIWGLAIATLFSGIVWLACALIGMRGNQSTSA